MLLKTVCEATAKLSTKAYASYSSISAISEDDQAPSHSPNKSSARTTSSSSSPQQTRNLYTRRSISPGATTTPSPRNNSMNSSTCSSLSGEEMDRRRLPSHPTLFQIGVVDRTSPGKHKSKFGDRHAKRIKSKHPNDNNENSPNNSSINTTISPTNNTTPTNSFTCFSTSSTFKLNLAKLHNHDFGTINPNSYNNDDDDYDDVESKLRHAYQLRDARELGLHPSKSLTLKTYIKCGGVSNLAIELVRLFSSTNHNTDTIQHDIETKVKPYCLKHNVSLDESIAQYTNQLCEGGQDDNPQALEKVSILARCCTIPETKCQIVLKALRAALCCTTTATKTTTNTKHNSKSPMELLTELANDALNSWANDDDDTIRSELEEALRLLVIDGIVIKYCGNGARELFRVSDPRHGNKLMSHVCRFVDESDVVEDALALCDAFNHLDRDDACVDILTRTMMAPPPQQKSRNNEEKEGQSSSSSVISRAEHCGRHMRKLYKLQLAESLTYEASSSSSLAENVATKLVMFASQTIIECVNRMHNTNDSILIRRCKRDARAACAAVCSVLTVIQENDAQNKDQQQQQHTRRSSNTNTTTFGSFSKLGSSSWLELLKEMRRLMTLQNDFNIYLSLPQLRRRDSKCKEVIATLLQPAIDMLLDSTINNTNNGNNKNCHTLKAVIAKAKRGCTLLFPDTTNHSHQEASSSLHPWWKAVGKTACHLASNANIEQSICFELLEASGMLDDIGNGSSGCESAVLALVDVAKALCERATKDAISLTTSHQRHHYHHQDDDDDKMDLNSWGDGGGTGTNDEFTSSSSTLAKTQAAMRCIARASSLLQEHGIVDCSRETLLTLVNISSLTDLINQILIRADGGVGEEIDSFRQQLQKEARARKRPLLRSNNRMLFQTEESSSSDVNDLDHDDDDELKKVRFLPPPILHPTWYIGDGLLLPPIESLGYCMMHYRDSTDNSSDNDANATSALDELRHQGDIFRFLNSRGAHTIALRLLSVSAANHLSSNSGLLSQNATSTEQQSWCDNSMRIYEETIRCLAERSLGGSGNGFTSGTIDSQLAVAHLLTLPLKLAFKVYRSALPSAINKRDFDRVVTLATIGVQAGGGGKPSNDDYATTPISSGWRKQKTFLAQCQRLASNANWWGILKIHNVAFDPRLFGDDASSGGGSSSSSSSSSKKYAASLVPYLIRNSSKTLESTDAVLHLAMKFGRSFNVDKHLPPQKHVEFLLSCPFLDATKTVTSTNNASSSRMANQMDKNPESVDIGVDGKTTTSNTKTINIDIRQDINACKSASKHALQLMPSSMAKCAVLRRCVMKLEASTLSAKDYERHSLVLCLYRNELTNVVKHYVRDPDSEEGVAFREELVRVERRHDALVVLRSFFKGERKGMRPIYPGLFLPLPHPFGSDLGKPMRRLCGVLGKNKNCHTNDDENRENDEGDQDVFDPLVHLQPALAADSGNATATALSPLCHSLGLPSGYVHARSLHERFVKAKSTGRPLPPFECVQPVLSRLQAPSDAAELAKWCADQYQDDASSRLAALEQAHLLSIKVSNEAELKRQRYSTRDDQKLVNNEQKALEVVKHIGGAFSALSDKVKVHSIFFRNKSKTTRPSTASTQPVVPFQVHEILSTLVDVVEQQYMGKTTNTANNNTYHHLPPEKFVEGLLTEASMMAAKKSLDEKESFTMEHFREVASIVHEACSVLAEQHSHVHVGKVARVLARRWLVHGDDVASTSIESPKYNNNGRGKNKFSKESSLTDAISHCLVDDPYNRSIAMNKNKSFLDPSAGLSNLTMNEDDDTVNFVMDLNAFGSGQDVWNDDVGSGVGENSNFLKLENVTFGEERSGLKKASSAREMAEYSNARAALRIAFVMSFAKDYFVGKNSSSSSNNGDENNSNISLLLPSSSMSKDIMFDEDEKQYSKENHCNHNRNDDYDADIAALPSKFEVNCNIRGNKSNRQRMSGVNSSPSSSSRFDPVKEHAVELLNIAFAESGGSDWKKRTNETKRSSNDNNLSPLLSMRSAGDHKSEKTPTQHRMNGGGKTVTFAMRHRALRAVSILCPQEILESVIDEQGYFNGKGVVGCSLDRCKFASYVSMEIEAMGLPLPHSDLVHLSMMHFSSYARALWRHHAQKNECHGFKGRLLHLLLELCTKNEKISDAPLVTSVLSEMMKLELPRTLLSGCERIARSDQISARVDSISSVGNGEGARVLSRAVSETTRLIIRGFQSADIDVDECLQVVERLAKVVMELEGGESLALFSEELCKLANETSKSSSNASSLTGLSKRLLEVAFDSACNVKEGKHRSELFSKILAVDGGLNVVNEFHRAIESGVSSPSLVKHLEGTLSLDIKTATNRSFRSDS